MRRYLLRGFLLAACALCLGACNTKTTEFKGSFVLTDFLKKNITNFNQNLVTINMVDASGNPVPHALLRMEWTETGARMSIQSDENGSVSMHFEEDMLDYEIVMSVDTKPEGQVIMDTKDYESSTTPVKDATLRLSW